MPLPQALIRVPGDYFYQPDSSSARSFLPQGLFRPVRFISSLLFFSTGIISIGQIHLWFALFPHRDYFYRPDSSLACSFLPQGLFRLARFIPTSRFPPLRMHSLQSIPLKTCATGRTRENLKICIVKPELPHRHKKSAEASMLSFHHLFLFKNLVPVYCSLSFGISHPENKQFNQCNQ